MWSSIYLCTTLMSCPLIGTPLHRGVAITEKSPVIPLQIFPETLHHKKANNKEKMPSLTLPLLATSYDTQALKFSPTVQNERVSPDSKGKYGANSMKPEATGTSRLHTLTLIFPLDSPEAQHEGLDLPHNAPRNKLWTHYPECGRHFVCRGSLTLSFPLFLIK